MHFSFSSNKANDRNKKHDFILFSQLSSSPWGVNFNFFMLSVFTVYTDNRVTFVYQFVLAGTHLWPFSKSKLNLKSDRVNLVAPAASPIWCLLYLPYVQAIQYKLGPEKLTRLGNSNVLRLPVLFIYIHDS